MTEFVKKNKVFTIMKVATALLYDDRPEEFEDLWKIINKDVEIYETVSKEKLDTNLDNNFIVIQKKSSNEQMRSLTKEEEKKIEDHKQKTFEKFEMVPKKMVKNEEKN